LLHAHTDVLSLLDESSRNSYTSLTPIEVNAYGDSVCSWKAATAAAMPASTPASAEQVEDVDNLDHDEKTEHPVLASIHCLEFVLKSEHHTRSSRSSSLPPVSPASSSSLSLSNMMTTLKISSSSSTSSSSFSFLRSSSPRSRSLGPH
jgi:hypothetical protein